MWDFSELSKKYTAYQLGKLRAHQPILKTCPVCDQAFDGQSYVFRPTAIYPIERQTCSDQCKRIHGGRKNKQVIKDYVCEGCLQPFTPHPKKPHQRFCRKLCRGLLLKNQPRPEVAKWAHKLVPPRNSVSEGGTAWLDSLNVPLREHTIHIKDRFVRVDGFDPSSNTVYEYLGSFWHGNPAIYQPNDINPVNNKTFGQLYQDTIDRLDLIRHAGYTVVYHWSPR